MEKIKYYHKNSDVVAFKKETYLDGYSYESTYDEKGNELTFKGSYGVFIIKGKNVSKKEFEEFIHNHNRPCAGKKVIVDGVEYELK